MERLIDHLEWANARAARMVGAAGDDRALGLLAHILAAEEVWLARLETGSSEGMEIWPTLSLESCEALASRNVERFRRYLRARSAADLDELVSYRNSKGAAYETPAREILLHVLLHGAHHRGQIARAIRERGDAPLNTDFITFARAFPAD